MRSISRPVCVAGPVFLDVVMSGLSHAPRPGEEQWVTGCAVAPGGSANQAVALARLGLPVTLCCDLGEDRAGDGVAQKTRDLLQAGRLVLLRRLAAPGAECRKAPTRTDHRVRS